MNEIVNIIVTLGGVLFYIIFICGVFSDEISKIIRALRGDDEE